MERRRIYILFLCFTIATVSSLAICDARKTMGSSKVVKHPRRSSMIKTTKNLKVISTLYSLLGTNALMDSSSSNTQPYVGSPFNLPPYDSLGPISLPQNAPPYCIYPPSTPQPPSTTIPTPITLLPPPSSYIPPIFPIQSPPPSPFVQTPSPPESILIPSPPEAFPSPPSIVPNPPETVPSPFIFIPSPPYIEPSPPSFIPSPPTYIPSPTGFVPSPSVFKPPVVFPPPAVPPPRNTAPTTALWCVAKPTVPDPIIQEAMNYACGSGADCYSIQPSGPCFEPNTLFAHASFAFNSYWQKTRAAGGTCEFGGTSMLVTVDPSYDGCHFEYY
ncbi:extensin-like [Tripterygium wilfordii]|uniref:Extensin-like n=1 Tax=Tripterygium wilfordii TaxID=458696 RepID=A0A7J7C2H2_TRIWF|nr:extensin-like [Tripterygium wilfordii]KAF5728125.1 extensin-like [Tripterygium wilfordii]